MFSCSLFFLKYEGKMNLWAGTRNAWIQFLLLLWASYLNFYFPAFFQLQKWEYFLYPTRHPIQLFACTLLCFCCGVFLKGF